MEIIKYAPDSDETMHSPSTGEDIFAPDMEEINDTANAFMAYWHHEVLNEPEIRDKTLRKSWDKYYSAISETADDYFDLHEALMKFLKEYDNPKWIVYECTFHGIACGPISFIVWYVVKADTIFETRDK